MHAGKQRCSAAHNRMITSFIIQYPKHTALLASIATQLESSDTVELRG